MKRDYVELLKEVPQLDMSGRIRMIERLNLESATMSTPSVVKLGAFKGLSLPVWSTGATATEEIYFRSKVPDQWNDVDSAILELLVALSSSETADTKFQLNCSWDGITSASLASSSVTSVDSGDINVDSDTLATASAYFTYCIPFTLSSLVAGEYIAGRIRRIANSAGSGISGEVIVLDASIKFYVNKIYGKDT